MKDIYLVTGAAGHLGNVIANTLALSGEQVRALLLDKDYAVSYLENTISRFVGDVLEPESLDSFFEHGEQEELIVIHCAGIVSISSAYQQKVHDVNIFGTMNIVEQCHKHHVKKLIYISSVHAIPEGEKGSIILETNLFHPDLVSGHYAKSKAEATDYVLRQAKIGLHVIVVHPSGICGPCDYGHGHTNQLIIDYCKGRLVSSVIGGYDFVDVRDVAHGVIMASKKAKSGECYILSNRYVSVKEFLDLLSEITGRKKVKNKIPMWFAKITAPASELYYKIRQQTPLYTAYSLYTLSSNSYFSHEKADRELTYTVRPFKQTLQDTVSWLKRQRRI